MIDLAGIISIPFLKKSVFTGSYRGMRYLLRKDEDSAETGLVLTAVIWPEPFNYVTTAEEKKQSKAFSFDESGLAAAVAWLNEEYIRYQER